MPKPYLAEFRADVIQVTHNRDENTTLAEGACNFGLHEGTIRKWMRQAELEEGKPNGGTSGPTTDEKSELAAANQKIRRLEQELEVMRRAAAYFGQAQIPSK